jgi:GTP-binding protein
VHVIDVSGASGRDPAVDLRVLRHELELFDAELARKPQLVAANKIDALSDEAGVVALEHAAADLRLPFFRISAVSGSGVPLLLEEAWRRLSLSASDDAQDGGSRTPPPAMLTQQE